MTDTIAFEIAVTKSQLSKKAVAEALGISGMSLIRKASNITEFKASEISKLVEILKLNNEERDKIFFARFVD